MIGRFSQLEELYFIKGFGLLEWQVDYDSISKFFDQNYCLRKLKRYHIEIGNDCKLYGSMKYMKPKGLYIQHFDASTSNAIIEDLVQREKFLHL